MGAALDDGLGHSVTWGTEKPRLIGFGISDKDTFDTACRYAEGAIIGSAFMKQLIVDG